MVSFGHQQPNTWPGPALDPKSFVRFGVGRPWLGYAGQGIHHIIGRHKPAGDQILPAMTNKDTAGPTTQNIKFHHALRAAVRAGHTSGSVPSSVVPSRLFSSHAGFTSWSFSFLCYFNAKTIYFTKTLWLRL